MKFAGIAGHGLKHYQNVAADNTKVLVSAGPVNLFGFKFEAGTSEVQYLQCFNAASTGAVTLGTTVPDFTVMVPSSDGVLCPPLGPLHHFNLGLVIAVTKTSRTGSTNVAAAACVDLWYGQQ